MTFGEFIASKTQSASTFGFKPIWIPDFLFDFQKSLVEWSIHQGRSGLFEDCGLGKTAQQLVWAENVVRKTNKPVLILTPIAVGSQTVQEGEKFGIECVRSRDGKNIHGAKIVVTNYERMHYFSPHDYAGIVCDESSILKNFDGVTRDAIVEFMRTIEYRLLCTATAAPNDYVELGNSSEALGELGFQDMISRFFKQETSKDHLGWGRTKYRMRGHAEHDFWRWVCSWSRAIRRPSDLGFNDDKFILPPLEMREHIVESTRKRDGFLFDVAAISLQEQREERRRTIDERCAKVAELVKAVDGPSIAWCFLNDEGDKITELIPGAVQVSGDNSDDEKEEIFHNFSSGNIKKLVTKPVLAAWGLNWQHCAHEVFFPSHSFEQYYQAVRRCLRFGQQRSVIVDIVTSKGEAGVMANLQKKQEKADAMFAKLVELMSNSLKIERRNDLNKKEKLPTWLSPQKPRKQRKEQCLSQTK